MRQLAWLRATPEGQEKSRWTQYVEQDVEVPLPNIEGWEYLVSLLDNAGTILQTGMGVAPLTWQELESWKNVYSQELVCWKFSFWELSTMKDMSYAYCAELGQASDKNRPQPYSPTVIDREEISKRMYNLLSAFKKNKS
jgi:hypothetical protein